MISLPQGDHAGRSGENRWSSLAHLPNFTAQPEMINVMHWSREIAAKDIG